MKAYELIADEKNWCKGEAAIDKNGNPVFIKDITACRWCLVGAVRHVYIGTDTYPDQVIALNQKFGGLDRVFQFNDAPNRTHAEVIAVLKELDI